MRRFPAERLVLVALLLPSLAVADPRPVSSDARPHLDHGLERFAARDFAAAIAAFDAGFAIDPHPDFLYAKGQAQRLGGDCRDAVVTYRAFLDLDPPETEAALARGNVARCERVLAASRTPDPPPARPVVEGQPATPHVRPWWSDRPAQVLSGASALALATSAAFAIHARGQAKDSAQSGNLEGWQDRQDTWRRDRTIAGIALGAGAGLAIGATVRFWYTGRRSSATVSLTGQGDGAVLFVQGRW